MKLTKLLDGRGMVRQADQARDAGHWLQAAELYGQHLEKVPDDFSIIVQRGNCLKDGGKYAEALIEYNKAIGLKPNDADVHLQRGHLMKMMGRGVDAIASYQEALRVDPKNSNVIQELLAMDSLEGIVDDTPIGVPAEQIFHTIWLDVTDMMEYARHNQSLSGIQRVVANLVLYAEGADIPGYRIIPVVPEYDRYRVLAANPAVLGTLIRLFDAPVVDRSMINKAINAVYNTRYQVVPAAGDIFAVAGAFWIYPHYDLISRLRQRGMRFCVFIHDLIQIKNPEYVQQEAVDKFQKQLIDVFSVSDFVLANSEFVASEIREYFETRLNYSVAVKAIPLATELRGKSKQVEVLDSDITEIFKEDYVLCVSTIEVRKNHMYLIRTWERLRREFGDRTPKLVLVGKWGWQIDHLRHHLDRGGYVGDWLFIFNGISDNALEQLYRNCLFTAYVSFAEGFGLPIGESLVYGKPCISANTTSMPEVGGEFVRYIDPYNVEGGYETFRKVIADRGDLERWTDHIRKDFRYRSWDAFCSEFFSTAVSMAENLGDDAASLNCKLPAGVIVPGGDSSLLRLAETGRRILTFRAARSTGWHAMEPWGVWSANRRARIVFDTDLPEGEAIKIYFRVRCPPGSENAKLVVKAGADTTEYYMSDQDHFFVFDGTTAGNGRVSIELLAQGRYGSIGEHACHVGLSAIAYCRASAALDRIDLMEKIALAPS